MNQCRLPPSHPSAPPGQKGFSLVEIVVGMLVGALGVVMILQIFGVSEGQKRTITSGGDALTNASIALGVLQADIRNAGYTIPPNLMGCNLTLAPGVTLTPLAPLVINPPAIPAGDPNTDILMVAYGSSAFMTDGEVILNPSIAPNYTVGRAIAFVLGDRVVAATATCIPVPVLDTLGGIIPPAPPQTTPFNLTVGNQQGAAMRGGTLYNFGPAPTVRVYAIRRGNLTACDYFVNGAFTNNCGLAANTTNAAVWVPIATNIVSLRAQYGHDTLPSVPGAPSYPVDTYDQAQPANGCGWWRTPVIRLALVARSDQLEKPTSAAHVTTAAPTWAGSVASLVGSVPNPTAPINPVATPINLTATPVASGFTWQDYRYKVLEINVPIRNVTLLGVQQGC